MLKYGRHKLAVALWLVPLVACVDSGGGDGSIQSAVSCMTCHNGSQIDDYGGPGIENPHPFPGADMLSCTVCHGGNGNGGDKLASHVPPPPQIGDKQQQTFDRHAWFNRLTLAGIDKFPDYTANGQTYSALDYLQFINPGDLRVISNGRSCGQCHQSHTEYVTRSLLATEAGIFSGASYAAGEENLVVVSQGLHVDTAADLGFRAVTDHGFQPGSPGLGEVGVLLEQPELAVHNKNGPLDIHKNQLYNAPGLSDDLNPDNSVITGSPLATLYHEMISTTCGDCHLGSAGANNRYGDFRSSGCTACHMPYAKSGRSGSKDPYVNKVEPLDPDDIDPPERAHVRAHRIRSVYKTLSNGVQIKPIDDYTCAGCHQGSNRTVMQYWGIRLDQNQDVKNNRQYPANPASFSTTHGDKRLFSPVVNNNTFNGRNRNQYLLKEDYDGDGRDDTPPDVHYEAGLGCIDCHGSHDLHGGDVNDPNGARLLSRMEQAVAIRCESCHGAADAYAPTKQGLAFNGQTADLAMDAEGLVLNHVVKESDGNYYLYSKLDGARHFVPQTLDTVVDNGKQHPFTSQPLYSAKASYAMGRADGNAATGTGPLQTGSGPSGFSHSDSMSCQACHSSWTNTCMGCHLVGEYDLNPNLFSNITGERIVFKEDNADFVYQSPVFFQLGVGPDDRIGQMAANTKVFFSYEDLNNQKSQVFSFTDRNGGGNNPNKAFPSLSHNVMLAHSIRGKVSVESEGPRYCSACHLTDAGLATWGAEYDAMRSALASGNFGALDFPLLRDHIGRNTGNQMGSPLWINMVAGLGSGLFLFDQDGRPQNPLDTFAGRKGAGGVAPANYFDPLDVTLDLDRIVDPNGIAQGSSNHPRTPSGPGPDLREGALDPNLAGPLGKTLIERLTDPTTGIVLDSWIDADGQLQGDASTHVGGP